MNPNINDLSKVAELKRALAAKNVSTAAISTLERALNRGMEFKRAEDLAILDILPPGCSKGVALCRLAESQDIAASEIMAIGDNFNDLEMLEFSGQPVVMANAAPELLQVARVRGWQVAASNDQDGVARILESLVESMGVQSVASHENGRAK